MRRIALDASDAVALTTAATGAAVVYNCTNPGNYTKWEAEWPPIYQATILAAKRTVIVRASDYLGVGIGQNGMGTRLVEAAAKGKAVQAIGEIDLPHAWTYVPDVAATIIAAAANPADLGVEPAPWDEVLRVTALGNGADAPAASHADSQVERGANAA